MHALPHRKATAVLATLAMLMGAEYAPGAEAPTPAPTAAPVQVQAEPFDLSAVRLLDGPFRAAMARNANYLLQLDPDRLLARVRASAGLEPKAPNYGGWEAQGIASHSLGHYLSACALHYAATGDQRFKERADYIVAEMAVCQAAGDDGYVAGIPRGREIFAEVRAGDIRSQGFDLNGGWVPWYTMHKLLAGLRDAHRHCNAPQALDVLTRLADYCWSVVKDLDDAQMQRMLACEHGGMNEIAADLYALTGQAHYLTMAEKFYHRAVLDPLARQEDRLAGLHANTQVPKVIGAARLHELTGKVPYATIARFFWDRVVHHYSYVNGGNSYNEMFGPPDRFAHTLHDTTETCNTYNMLKLTRHLFAWQPQAELMDFYERALLNHILAHQHPETGMLVYKGFLDPATRKHFSTPFDSFWCCVGTGMENHTKYGETIYYHADDALYVNLYISSRLTWADQQLTLTQRTDWPFGDQVALELQFAEPRELSLHVRHPYWARQGVTVQINDEPVSTESAPGSYLTLRRTWQDGDTVKLHLPMALRYETMPDDANRLAFFYGPTLLAALLDDDANAAPALVCARDELLDHVAPINADQLIFQTRDLGKPDDTRLVPLFRVADQRYSVYLEHFTPQRWQTHQAERAAELQRQRDLAARTTDFFQPGEMQPEREHNLTGEKIRHGRHHGRAWRDAYDGGWFSFDMTVDPDHPMTLICTYWGDDAGGRIFDILVAGQKVATQTLDRPKPGAFADVAYPLPPHLTKGKPRVSVRLQAHPERVAGGLFGCRMVRSMPEDDAAN